MKAKSPIKIFLILFILSTALMAVALFVASKRFKPEELKKVVITQLEQALPNSHVTTKALDFSIGLNSSLQIKGVDISLKGSRKYPLASIEELQLRIPFWSLLFGGGKVELSLNGTQVHYIELSRGSNWENAFKKSSKPKVSKRKKSISNDSSATGSSSSLVVPGFLATSELNVSILDVMLKYSLRDKTNGKINIEKLLLKDVGVKSKTGFELKSKIEVLAGSPNKTSFELLVIGESKLFDWISKKEIDINSNIVLTDIESAFLKRGIKDISLKQRIKLKQDMSYIIKSNIFLEEKEIIKSSISSQKNDIYIDDIKMNIFLKDIIDLVMNEAELPIKLSGKEKLSATGSVILGKSIRPELKFNITPALKISQGTISTVSELKGVASHKGLNLDIDTKVLSGHIKTYLNISTNWTAKSFEKLKPIKAVVDIRDIKLTPSVIPKQSSKSQQEKASPTVGASSSSESVKSTSSSQIIGAPLDLKATLTNIDLAGAKLDGQIGVNVTSRGGLITARNLRLDEGLITLKNKISLNKGFLRNDFEMGLKKVNLNSINGFLPKKIIDGISGAITGKTIGYQYSDKYFAKVDLDLVDGKLTKLNLQSYITGLIDKLGPLKKSLGKDKLRVNGEFENMLLSGTFDNNRHSISKFVFNAKDKKIALIGTGNIYPSGPKQSLLNISLNINDPKLVKSLNKDVGTNKFPLLLEGKGYAIFPNYEYTLKSIGKIAVKTQAKKEIKKFIKSKKAKKLLKGLFK